MCVNVGVCVCMVPTLDVLPLMHGKFAGGCRDSAVVCMRKCRRACQNAAHARLECQNARMLPFMHGKFAGGCRDSAVVCA